MEIPYYIFLIIYGGAVLALLSFFSLHLYHIAKFGWFDFMAKFNTILFLVVIVVILGLTFFFLQDIPWTESFEFFDFNKIFSTIL